MTTPSHLRLAHRLDTAQNDRSPIPSLADTHPLGIDDAYAVQEALVGLRQARGERLTGVKLGFTSKAKMVQMGVCEVIVGRLTDAMRIGDGAELELSDLIHPRVEPEVAFRLSKHVDSDDPTTDIESCVDAVAPALEVIDSRYQDFRFTVTDVVADNTSAAAYAVGAWRPLGDVTNKAVRLRTPRQEAVGSTAAILGAPLAALHALLAICRKRRIPLAPGQIVLAGAATAALPLTAGVTACHIAGLGTVTLKGR
jgi:2-oxo-3-hexenedioate decarboxylase